MLALILRIGQAIAPPTYAAGVQEIEGLVTAVDVAPKQTRITLNDGVRPITFTVPGSNAAAPSAVWGVPRVVAGERWKIRLVTARIGLTPAGLGEGMTRVYPPDPPYNLNGLAYPATSLPMTFLLNEAGSADLGIDGTEGIVLDALGQWTNVGCASFQFVYGGRTSLPADEDDGKNVLGWVETGWEWDPAVAGLTQTRFGLDDSENVVPVGADIVFNADGWDFTTGLGSVAGHLLHAPSVLVHELGHVTGMDHEYHYVTSTMFYAYVGGMWSGTLSGDDRRGLCENYPSGHDECATDDDCAGIDASPRVCRDIGAVKVCDEVRAAQGDFCNLDDFNCVDYCVLNKFATAGYCTVACDEASCPDGWTCGATPTVVLPDDDKPMCERAEDTGGAQDSGEPDDSGVASDSGPTETSKSDKGKTGGCAGGGAGCNAAGPVGALTVLISMLSSRRRRSP